MLATWAAFTLSMPTIGKTLPSVVPASRVDSAPTRPRNDHFLRHRPDQEPKEDAEYATAPFGGRQPTPSGGRISFTDPDLADETVFGGTEKGTRLRPGTKTAAARLRLAGDFARSARQQVRQAGPGAPVARVHRRLPPFRAGRFGRQD
jgi:hypothetical protein